METKFLEQPIAITDVETTGLDPSVHEIIEIGLVLVDQKTLEIIDTLDIKVKPEHLETADPAALEINGYNDGDWQKALTLQGAMQLYEEKTREAIFCAHNATFDWPFILEAFRRTGVKDQMDYHRLDSFTIAWLKLRDSGLETFSLRRVAKFLGIKEEPLPHRAINGAMIAYEIFKKLVLLERK